MNKIKKILPTCYECNDEGIDCSSHVGRGSKRCLEIRTEFAINNMIPTGLNRCKGCQADKYGCTTCARCYGDIYTKVSIKGA